MIPCSGPCECCRPIACVCAQGRLHCTSRTCTKQCRTMQCTKQCTSPGAVVLQAVLRSAFALGADRAIHVKTDATSPLLVSRVLCELAKQEDAGLLMLGKQAIDDDNNQTVRTELKSTHKVCNSTDFREVCRDKCAPHCLDGHRRRLPQALRWPMGSSKSHARLMKGSNKLQCGFQLL
jgi:hypothetical protein